VGVGAGKAGGFLALDWQDGGATGPLGRLSFKLHQELADSLGQDIGYRRVQTLSAAAAPAKKGHHQANPLLSELTQCGTHSLHLKWQMKQAKAAAGIVKSPRDSCTVAFETLCVLHMLQSGHVLVLAWYSFDTCTLQQLCDVSKIVGWQMERAELVVPGAGATHSNTRGSQPNRRAGAPAWLDGSVSRIKVCCS